MVRKILSVLFLMLLLVGCARVEASPNVNVKVNTYYCKGDLSPFELEENPWAINPSYDKLLELLDSFEPKVLPTKSCGHYAEELHNYAESRFIKCAVVVSSTYFHSFTGFVVDGEMVYVDPNDGIISIAEESDGVFKFSRQNGLMTQSQIVGQVEDFTLFWNGAGMVEER
jgi:hypothetical protein